MAGFWSSFGKLALGFAEYALEQKYHPAPAGPVAVPVMRPANGVPLTNPPIEMPQPVDLQEKWRATIKARYWMDAPEGVHRDPDATEYFTDAVNMEKYGAGWLRGEMYKKNGAVYPPRDAA